MRYTRGGVLGPIAEYDNLFSYKQERCVCFRQVFHFCIKTLFVLFSLTFYATIVYALVYNSLFTTLSNQINIGLPLFIYFIVTFITCPYIYLCISRNKVSEDSSGSTRGCSSTGVFFSILTLIVHLVVFSYLCNKIYGTNINNLDYWLCDGYFFESLKEANCFAKWNMLLMLVFVIIDVMLFILTLINSHSTIRKSF